MCGECGLGIWVPYLWRPEKDIMSPRTGVTDIYESCSMGGENQTKSSAWVLYTLTTELSSSFKAIILIFPEI